MKLLRRVGLVPALLILLYGDPDDLYGRLEKMHRETPRRIDYIFVGPPSFLKSEKMILNSSRVVMEKVINGVHASLLRGLCGSDDQLLIVALMIEPTTGPLIRFIPRRIS